MKTLNSNPFAQVAKEAAVSVNAVTVKDLFTENNPHGYFSRKQLLEYVAGISEYQQQKLTLLLEYLSEGYRPKNVLIPVKDEYGNEILWLKIRVGETTLNFKMRYTAWLLRLADDCQRGRLKGFAFSAEEITDELAQA